MDMIFHYLQQGTTFVAALTILLGLLIFVHELGHFLVAKHFGVRVEVFSLGFGKKIFSHKKGDTEYCLSLIPFGGYVKMFGDDPTASIPESEKQHSFTHKPVGQRIAVVLAGPLMNFFFAILLFALIGMVGEEFAQPIVGDVAAQSQAGQAGFQNGDRILSVDGQATLSWDQVQKRIEEGENSTLSVVVARGTAQEQVTLSVQPRTIPNKNVLSLDEHVGDVEGLSPLSVASVVGVASTKSMAAQLGLQTFDELTAIGDQAVSRWTDLPAAFASAKAGTVILYKRASEDGKTSQDLSVTLPKEFKPTTLANFGLERSDLFISQVIPDSAAKSSGLLRGDRLTSVNNKQLAQWGEFVETVKAFQEGQAPLKVEIVRAGETKSFELTPRKISQTNATGHEEKTYAIGVMTGLAYANPQTVILKVDNVFKAIQKGTVQTVQWSKTTALSFLALVQNKVSAKSIGGPIMIGQLAHKTFDMGLSPFLKIMAIISINLFVLNLLPIPVLDGGHLVFFLIEAVKGNPLSIRKVEIAQQVGLVLLMGLMVFALFNDVSRLLNF